MEYSGLLRIVLSPLLLRPLLTPTYPMTHSSLVSPPSHGKKFACVHPVPLHTMRLFPSHCMTWRANRLFLCHCMTLSSLVSIFPSEVFSTSTCIPPLLHLLLVLVLVLTLHPLGISILLVCWFCSVSSALNIFACAAGSPGRCTERWEWSDCDSWPTMASYDRPTNSGTHFKTVWWHSGLDICPFVIV